MPVWWPLSTDPGLTPSPLCSVTLEKIFCSVPRNIISCISIFPGSQIRLNWCGNLHTNDCQNICAIKKFHCGENLFTWWLPSSPWSSPLPPHCLVCHDYFREQFSDRELRAMYQQPPTVSFQLKKFLDAKSLTNLQFLLSSWVSSHKNELLLFSAKVHILNDFAAWDWDDTWQHMTSTCQSRPIQLTPATLECWFE